MTMPYGTDLKGPITVLHVEDDLALAVLVRKALARRGHETVRVTSGDEALRLIAGGDIDVVALDHTLTTETGMEIPASGGRLGPKAPQPAATMTARAVIRSPAAVPTDHRPSSIRVRAVTWRPRR